jgi:UDPglucose--hexose-1-phosphate uridylyltransferase
VFKNEGPRAGASVEHCHSQLIGIPFVPTLVAEELAAVNDLDCFFCRIASGSPGWLVVSKTDGFYVFSPFAPRFPGETWVVPTTHAARFEETTDADLSALAPVLLDLLARMARAFADPAFNLLVKSAPFRYEGPYHWRIEILPRTTTPAGWEWGTGLMINTLFPERAAEMLRG